MLDRHDPRSDDGRDRGDSWDRSFGSRGGAGERDRDEHSRDVFTRNLDLPRGRDREQIDAKRQALDALDNLRRGCDAANGNGKPANGAEIALIVEVADDLTSQSRQSLVLQGSPPSGKLLIPLARRDVRVVEGARLESVCRGNSTEGSNPSLSARFPEVFRYVAPD